MRAPVRLALFVAVVTPLAGCAALPLVAATLPGGTTGSSAIGGGITSSGSSNTPTFTDGRDQDLQIEPHTDGDLSFYGDLIKKVGEPAELYDSSGQVRLASVIVTAIIPDPACTNTPAVAPVSGHYLEVELTVHTTASVGTAGMPANVDVAGPVWFASIPNWNGGSGATRPDDRCDVSGTAIPASLGPSQTVSGHVMLDVSEPTDVISLLPNEDNHGYEWDFTRPPTWTATPPPLPSN